MTLEQRDRAKLQLQRALVLFQSLGRHVDAADALLVLGINERAESPKAAYYVRSLDELRLAGKDAPLALLFRAKVYRAATLKDFQRIQEVQALLDEAIALGGRDPAIPADLRSGALQLRGETLLEQGHFDQAEEGLRQAITLSADAFDAWAMLARSSSLQQNFRAAAELARRDYELAAQSNPEDKLEAEVWWARYRAEAGETAEALAQLRKAMPAVRKYCRSGHLLALYEQAAARAWNTAGHFREAEQCARTALDLLREDQMPEIHPLIAASLEDLGMALRGLGRSREALPALEESLELYHRLGPAYAKTGGRVQSICTP